MISYSEIGSTVALAFCVESADIFGASRSADIVQARHVAMWLARQHTPSTLPQIATGFGRLDHTTVIYAVERVDSRMREDATFAAAVRALSESIAFRADMTARDTIDVLPLARRIVLNPRRDAVRASVHEIVALATSTNDLWDIAVAAERMAALHAQRRNADAGDAGSLDQQITEIGATIINTMAAICGTAEEDQSS